MNMAVAASGDGAREDLLMPRKSDETLPTVEPAAGNGILNRRVFLESALVAGATGAAPAPRRVPIGMKGRGATSAPYGHPSKFESKVGRATPPPANPATR